MNGGISSGGWIGIMAVAWGVLLVIGAPSLLWIVVSAYCVLQSGEASRQSR